MTRPRFIFFGWEKNPSGLRPKVFLRCLLFSTGKRGRVIQNMYLRVRRGQTEALFSLWAYGEKNDLVPGSGLFVSQEGIACNHHFLSTDNPDFPQFSFSPGDYLIQIYADLLNRLRHTKLGELTVSLSEEESARMHREGVGILFDWNPDLKGYLREFEEKPNPVSLTPPPRLRPGL